MKLGQQRVIQVAILALCGIAFYIWTGAGWAVECGPDEGMELSKALLVARDPGVWQRLGMTNRGLSPLIYAKLFEFANFRPWGPRMLTLVLCVAMCALFPRLMPKGNRWMHLLFACLFLFTWPFFSQLCVAAMIDLPAFSIAIIASALLPRNREEWNLGRFAMCGLLFALATQFKLTCLRFQRRECIWSIGLAGLFGNLTQDSRVAVGVPALGFRFPPLVGLCAFAVASAMIIKVSPTWTNNNFGRVTMWRRRHSRLRNCDLVQLYYLHVQGCFQRLFWQK